MSDEILFSPVTALPKIGKARAALFGKMGIETLYDLLTYFPRAYEDRTHFVPIAEISVGVPACFRATVISVPTCRPIRGNLTLTKVTVADETSRLYLTFFNQPYVVNQLQYGRDYCFFGTLQEGYGAQMTNPQFEPAESCGQKTNCIVPIYSLTDGMRSSQVAAAVSAAMSLCLDDLPDVIPQSVRDAYHMLPAKDAYRLIHAPTSQQALAEAKRRLVFEEFFIFSAGLMLLRAKREKVTCEPWTFTDLSKFEAALPYRMTAAQRNAVSDILRDLSGSHPMNRLVQGDVGSGKTAVAAAAAFIAWKNGKQTALMAPTEILARQHFASLGNLLGGLGMEVVILTGSMSASEKKWVKNRLAEGKIDLLIGTHALLSEDVSAPNLGLVITDEQHRFGVEQRGTLADKAAVRHTLFLSATPIPRTLSLILYGDMDVSVISELPPGRQPVSTYLVGETMRPRIHAFIRKQVSDGHQVYVVCPAVEDNEQTDLKSAEHWADTLQKIVFPELRVGLLHGQMKSADKDGVMQAFASGQTDILVATTVIEVGVDVQNATLIVIEDADRFGLSQLHQLRGRVGRRKDASYCVLFSGNQRSETLKRLRAFCETNDGFRIAEADLALRGPGDFFGNRQHGLPQLKVADLGADLETLRQAQDATRCLSAEDITNDPAYEPLLERIRALFSARPPVLN